MTTWHQAKAIQRDGLTLYHPTKWTCYSKSGPMTVMRFDLEEDAINFAERTGDGILTPFQLNSRTLT